MNKKLGPMKCIHLDKDKVNLPEYFIKRNIYLLYAQPKLNGIRALWYHEDGLYTRGGHLITSVPHIVEALKVVSPHQDLDGELYHYNLPFNMINGAVRRILPGSTSAQLYYNVFDSMATSSRSQAARLQIVRCLPDSKHIKRVTSKLIRPKQIWYKLREMLPKGYEGVILRDPQAPYRPGRHVGNLWAVKPVYELEAEFLGFLDGETALHTETFGSMLLKLLNGRTFSCSGMTEDERLDLYLNKELKRGTEITIKFGAWSHEDPEKRVPLYPRFKCVRWDK